MATSISSVDANGGAVNKAWSLGNLKAQLATLSVGGSDTSAVLTAPSIAHLNAVLLPGGLVQTAAPVFKENQVTLAFVAPGGGTGSLNLRSAAKYAILASSAITGSTGAGSVVTGNMGIYPNTLSSVTNFPPSTVSGVIDADNASADQGQLDAMAAFTAGNALSATSISAILDGQTLTPGVYKESSGTFNLAASTNGTLTFNGAGTYIFQAASTLVTGAGAIPTMAFAGGATPANTFIYWLLGSSGTINSGAASAGSTFYGTVIAQASITATQAGTIDGGLFALTGAVTLSGTNNVNGVTASGGGLMGDCLFIGH